MRTIATLPSCVVAEEQGLVTVFVDRTLVTDGLQSRPRAHRVRLNPPAALLREDRHVFDIEAACGYVERRVLTPLVRRFPALRMTDAVVGLGRFTIGLRHPAEVAAAAVSIAIEQLDVDPW